MSVRNAHASGVGLDRRGVAVDAGYFFVAQPQDGGRLPGAYSEQLKFPPGGGIPGNFPIFHINPFPEQTIRAANQNTRYKFSTADLSQAGRGHDLVAIKKVNG